MFVVCLSEWGIVGCKAKDIGTGREEAIRRKVKGYESVNEGMCNVQCAMRM